MKYPDSVALVLVELYLDQLPVIDNVFEFPLNIDSV